VGRGTVSRVINRAPGVRDSTRELVEQAIAELGYVPNTAARALAGTRSGAVALVITEPEQRLFAEPFFSEIVHGVGAGLADSEIQLLLTLVRGDAERHRFVQYARAGRVDGVLLVSLHGSDPLPDMLAESGLPLVLGGRRHAGERVSYVDTDNAGGGRVAVRHLLDSGRRAVATITGPRDMYVAQCRLRGYRKALEGADGAATAAGDESWVAEGDFTEEGGGRAMATLLERHPELDAVFAASDVMAAGALRALRAAGRRVPEDVAVVGFDDSPVARHTDPQLTTVRQPVGDMGRAMVALLLDEIEEAGARDGRRGTREARDGSRTARQRLLPTRLVRRESA
jgi:DNA-binding LacI/PurR family transcriptional regulator